MTFSFRRCSRPLSSERGALSCRWMHRNAPRIPADRSRSSFWDLKETAPDFEFRERFQWTPPAVKVNVTFAFDEAVQHYAIDNVTACACPQ